MANLVFCIAYTHLVWEGHVHVSVNWKKLKLDPPTRIKVRGETNWNIRREMGRLSTLIELETHPRCYQVDVIELSALRTLPCHMNGKQLTGLEMVRRFHCERRLSERVAKAWGIIRGKNDEFDLRHYIPVDARACRHIHNIEGMFDHLVERLGLWNRVYGEPIERRLVRFFIDGTVFSSQIGSEQWTACVYPALAEEGYPAYRCALHRADLPRGEYDFSLVLG